MHGSSAQVEVLASLINAVLLGILYHLIVLLHGVSSSDLLGGGGVSFWKASFFS